MLDSVLFARDKWLRPGAELPPLNGFSFGLRSIKMILVSLNKGFCLLNLSLGLLQIFLTIFGRKIGRSGDSFASAGAGGQMFPDRARLLMAGMEDAEYREEKLLGTTLVWGVGVNGLQGDLACGGWVCRKLGVLDKIGLTFAGLGVIIWGLL